VRVKESGVIAAAIIVLSISSLVSCGRALNAAQDAVVDQAGKAISLLGKVAIDPGQVFSQASQGVMVIAQMVSGAGPTIRAFTNALGEFDLEIPDSLKDGEFIVSLVDSTGLAIGPLMDKASQIANGARSVGMLIGANLPSVDFGTIKVAASGLVETATAIAGISPVADIVARVSSAGVPVGMDSHGKGTSARSAASSARQLNDRDQDGLIDILDADDDGDGILDDFDSDSAAVDTGVPDGYAVDIGFWLNPSDQDYRMLYQTDPTALKAFVKTKYILEPWFNVRDATEAAAIAGVSLDPRNKPAYLDVMKTGPDSDPSQQVLWSAGGYRMNESQGLPPNGPDIRQWKNRLIVPSGASADLRAGDVFNFLVTKKDGSSLVVSRMLNFVFTNYPLLRYIGTNPASLTDYSALMVASIANPNATVPGSGGEGGPLTIADNADLTIRFQPPVDDLGQPIRKGGYRISIIPYNGYSQAWNIDQATWGGAPPVGAEGGYYNNNHLMLEVTVDQLQPSYDAINGTYSLTIPRACFPNSVIPQGGAAFVPSRYSIGIVAIINYSQVAFTVFVKK
jgi:hypothetical protein